MGVKQVIVFAVLAASLEAFLLHPKIRNVYEDDPVLEQHPGHGEHPAHEEHRVYEEHPVQHPAEMDPEMRTMMRCGMAAHQCSGMRAFNQALNPGRGQYGIRLVEGGELVLNCSLELIQETRDCMTTPECVGFFQMMEAYVVVWEQLCDNKREIIKHEACLENPDLINDSFSGTADRQDCYNIHSTLEACQMSEECITDFVAEHEHCDKDAGKLVAGMWRKIADAAYGKDCTDIPSYMQ